MIRNSVWFCLIKCELRIELGKVVQIQICVYKTPYVELKFHGSPLMFQRP